MNISKHHRDLIRPFAAPLGDLLDRWHGDVFELDRTQLLELREAVAATVAATPHGKGKFHCTAKFLDSMVEEVLFVLDEQDLGALEPSS